MRGRKLWETDGLSSPVVRDVRDFAGNGTHGLLLTADTGTEFQIYIVSGKTGKSLSLAMQNVFGGGERIGHLLPGVAGEQICAWWRLSARRWTSGTGPGREGYVWSFEKGVDNPTSRFKAEEFGVIYAPLHLIADMDGDGRPEMVMISHEQVWLSIWRRTRERPITWQPQIRSYMAQVAAPA